MSAKGFRKGNLYLGMLPSVILAVLKASRSCGGWFRGFGAFKVGTKSNIKAFRQPYGGGVLPQISKKAGCAPE